MNNPEVPTSEWAAKGERNAVLLGYWTTAWVVTMAIATFGPEFAWKSSTTLTVAAILLNVAVGVGMILANKRYLRGLDELHQKIQLEAMALSLGVALVAGLGYSNLDVTDVIAFDAEISHVVILMGITYGLGVLFGLRKYR